MTEQYIKTTGKLIYNPPRPGLKKTRNHDEFFLILEVHRSIGTYYRHWVYRRYGIKLAPPAFETHVTILDGRTPVQPGYLEHWKKYSGKIIELEYSPEIYRNWKFWCLPVRSPELVEIRKELGFETQKPLHITIGRLLDD